MTGRFEQARVLALLRQKNALFLTCRREAYDPERRGFDRLLTPMLCIGDDRHALLCRGLRAIHEAA